MKSKNAASGLAHRKRLKGGNHSNMITDYKVYHPGRDLSNGGFCNG